MEATLQSTYRVDYRDRFIPDPATGRPRLTLRRLAVLLMRGLPESAPVLSEVIGHRPWSRHEALLDDLRMTILSTTPGVKREQIAPHPDRVRRVETAQSPSEIEERAAVWRRRKAERERRLRGGV